MHPILPNNQPANNGGPEENRTPDLCNANAALWPTELRALTTSSPALLSTEV